MPELAHDGARLFFVDQGQGPRTLLLLHAFPLHSRMWAPQVAGLTDLARIVAPDARGFGKSDPAPAALTMDLAAADAAAVLDHLGIRRAVIAGLSMGGYVALALHRMRPDLFEGLVLADTRAGADSTEGRANRERFAASAIEKGMRWVADEMLPKLLSPSATPLVRERVRGIIRDSDPAAVAAAQRGMAGRPDATAALASIACPTLVLVGADDTLTPPADAQALASGISGARLVVIPAAGHLTNLEASDGFNAEIRAFLADLPAA